MNKENIQDEIIINKVLEELKGVNDRVHHEIKKLKTDKHKNYFNLIAIKHELKRFNKSFYKDICITRK